MVFLNNFLAECLVFLSNCLGKNHLHNNNNPHGVSNKTYSEMIHLHQHHYATLLELDSANEIDIYKVSLLKCRLSSGISFPHSTQLLSYLRVSSSTFSIILHGG